MKYINPINYYLAEIGQYHLPSPNSEKSYNLISKFAVSLPPCELRNTVKNFINKPHEFHRKVAVYKVHPEMQLEHKTVSVFDVFNSFDKFSPDNLTLSEIEIFFILYSPWCGMIRANLVWDYHKILTAMNWFIIKKNNKIISTAIGLNTSYNHDPGSGDFGWRTQPFRADAEYASFSSGWSSGMNLKPGARINPYPEHRFVIPIQ